MLKNQRNKKVKKSMGRNWKDYYKKEKRCELGTGGNGSVIKVRSKAEFELFALKQLNFNARDDQKKRFAHEIEIMAGYYESIEGIMPVTDCDLENFWYTMPIAEPAFIYSKRNILSVNKIIELFVQLCDTLISLHNNEISHRDIKPKNILYYKERLYLCDFGLVDFPGFDEDLTQSGLPLGAIFTISPEMKRSPKTADGKIADVYSFAKTLWMFLTQDEKGFEGQYNYKDFSHSLRYNPRFTDVHTVEIDELLRDATDNDPKKRPNMQQVKEKLLNWLTISSNYELSSKSDWAFLTKIIFGESPIPKSASWSNLPDIVNILNDVGTSPSYNHTLFADGGGLDFSRAMIAEEAGCIKLCFGSLPHGHGFQSTIILKPKSLHFEHFSEDCSWDYFLLELSTMPAVLDETKNGEREKVVEDIPGHYVSAIDSVYGVYDYDSGRNLPEGYEIVERMLSGSLLMVMKSGPYNSIPGTYDGRHAAVEPIQFREYTQKLCDLLNEIMQKVPKRKENCNREEVLDDILHLDCFNKNPFVPSKTYQPQSTMFQTNREYEKMIDERIEEISFSSIIEETGDEYLANAQISYCFEFSNPFQMGHDILSEQKHLTLCRDGFFKEIDSKCDASFSVNNRGFAKKIQEKILKTIMDFLGYTDSGFVCNGALIIPHKGTIPPSHLFTKDELKNILLMSDDRNQNQLVINEDGHFTMLSNAETYDAFLYPVRIESWNPRNLYVGKYSDLSHLDDTYKYFVYGWAMYLSSEETFFDDYIPEFGDIEAIIEEIKKYYSK